VSKSVPEKTLVVGRSPLRRGEDGPRVHRESVRTRTLRRDLKDRRRYQGRRRRGSAGVDDLVVTCGVDEGRGPRRAGYQTPSAVAPRYERRGKLLLIERADSGIWLYPTGCVNVAICAGGGRERGLRETGMEVEPVRLIGVLDGMRLGQSRIRCIPTLLRRAVEAS